MSSNGNTKTHFVYCPLDINGNTYCDDLLVSYYYYGFKFPLKIFKLNDWLNKVYTNKNKSIR